MDTSTSLTEAQKATNQFVEIFPNFWNIESKPQSLTAETLYVGVNGSLVFQNIYSYHSGRYLCHIANGIGHAIHQIVNVNVKGIRQLRNY